MSYEEEKQDRKIEQLEAEIERLRAEMENYGDDYVCQMKSKDARIQELEEALVEADQYRRSLLDQVMKVANQRDKAEVRIQELEDALVDCQYAPQPNGCDDWGNPIILSVSGGAYTGTTRSWQITEERKAAFVWILRRLEYDQSLPGHTYYKIQQAMELLRGMLKEAEQ